MPKILVIIPCGGKKVWSKDPDHGPALAKDAYTGVPFRLNRNYAEKIGDSWVILSAKYGFILPSFIIPEPYNVTFKRRSDDVATIEQLHRQIHELSLDQYQHIIGLGGKEYRAMIEAAFSDVDCTLSFPFSGLLIGNMMAATKAATPHTS